MEGKKKVRSGKEGYNKKFACLEWGELMER